MVFAALAEGDAALANAPYDVLQNWQEDYDGNLRIIRSRGRFLDIVMKTLNQES